MIAWNNRREPLVPFTLEPKYVFLFLNGHNQGVLCRVDDMPTLGRNKESGGSWFPSLSLSLPLLDLLSLAASLAFSLVCEVQTVTRLIFIFIISRRQLTCERYANGMGMVLICQFEWEQCKKLARSQLRKRKGMGRNDERARPTPPPRGGEGNEWSF